MCVYINNITYEQSLLEFLLLQNVITFVIKGKYNLLWTKVTIFLSAQTVLFMSKVHYSLLWQKAINIVVRSKYSLLWIKAIIFVRP